MQKNWCESFFQGVALDLWRKAVTVEQTLADVDFLEQALRLQTSARLLDIPCGNGRHSLQLASRGYHVTGIDLSAEFIAEAKASAAERGLDVGLLRQDLRDVSEEKGYATAETEFDGAFCFGNSFGYIDHEESCAFLRAVSSSLKPGARFAMETGVAAESLLPRLGSQQWRKFDDILS